MSTETLTPDVREIPDLPGYFVGADRSVWCGKTKGPKPRHPRDTPLRPVRVYRRSGEGQMREVFLTHDGRTRHFSVDSLYRRVFGE